MSKKCFMMAGRSLSGMEGRSAGSETSERNNISLERDIESSGFCVARPAFIPVFSGCPIASWILTGTEQEPRSHLLKRHADFIIDSDPQAFSRRLPWHPQDPTKFAVAAPQLGMEQPPGSSGIFRKWSLLEDGNLEISSSTQNNTKCDTIGPGESQKSRRKPRGNNPARGCRGRGSQGRRDSEPGDS